MDSPDLLYDDLMRVGRHSNDPVLLRFYVDHVQEAYERLIVLGVESTGLIYQGGSSVKRSICHRSMDVLKTLSAQIDERGIPILFNTKAKRLVIDLPNQRVLGVEAEGKEGHKI